MVEARLIVRFLLEGDGGVFVHSGQSAHTLCLVVSVRPGPGADRRLVSEGLEVCTQSLQTLERVESPVHPRSTPFPVSPTSTASCPLVPGGSSVGASSIWRLARLFVPWFSSVTCLMTSVTKPMASLTHPSPEGNEMSR